MGKYEGVGLVWSSQERTALRLPWTEGGALGETFHTPEISESSGRGTPGELSWTQLVSNTDRGSIFVNCSRATSGDECSPVSVQLDHAHGPSAAQDVADRFLNVISNVHIGDPLAFSSWNASNSESLAEDLMKKERELLSPALSLVSWSADSGNDRETDDLIRAALSTVLLKWVTENEQDMLVEGKLHDASPFHASRIPNISVEAYFERIYTFAFCSKACYVIALLYLDRLSRRNASLRMTSFTAHRLIITAVMLAAKFFDDIFYNNAYYAKVGGLPLREMNALEVRMLRELAYQLNVSLEEFHAFERVLLCKAIRAAPDLGKRLEDSGFPLQRSLWRPICNASPLSASSAMVHDKELEENLKAQGTATWPSNLAVSFPRSNHPWEVAFPCQERTRVSYKHS
ncbi:hypothetical protein CCYA_CCYA13G3613 [Cyanidiococcus yangmingshanensis]|uniref:Mitochondrial peripheral inner membrane protein n=1 Tax=Cyanidiococcus yangmingshanensis TaxID=2690220 RepID=A0A7J7IFG4_9RHOD|nr:mitochondrial peripheral inner membrane protein [Cyanidiococcus yangmingshanensis]KAK4532756.1 hypothetical protein CCYA_CCYA13G3613 [Cyanidiococcus yangmingshanensis]